MRTLDAAKASWRDLAQYQTVRDLKNAVRLEAGHSIATAGVRSWCWKVFLVFDTLDMNSCQRTLASSRSAYNTLRSHFLRYIENPNEVSAGFDPLSQDPESSPWTQLRQDEELRQEILQDVERLPQKPFFRQADTQRMLLDILFIFCKLNPDVGYRQGMHEILAPIAWVVYTDAIDIGESSRALGEDALIKNIFDSEHIEHDAFTLFGQVMQSCKSFYVSEGPNSIMARSRRIFDDLLPQVDIQLKRHVENLDIVPQVYLIRWIRLLFGREFAFDSVLELWDVLFAEDPSLEIVDYICLAMILRIRWKLLDADYNAALGILLNYHENDTEISTQALAYDAVYLQSHLNLEGGSFLVQKYTGRPLLSPGRPVTPPAIQRNSTTYSGSNFRRRAEQKTGSPSPRPSRQARNIEAVLQNTAKNLYAQSEKLGIGKAVRNAVDEVHRKAQELREAQTSPPPFMRIGNSARSEADAVDERLRQLEGRNRHLSELLAEAVNELWDCQKVITESGEHSEGREENIEKLSAAIAKAQLVQVYLDEPGLVLADSKSQSHEDTATAHSRRDAEPPVQIHEKIETPADESSIDSTSVAQAHMSPSRVAGLADPSVFDDLAVETSPSPKPVGEPGHGSTVHAGAQPSVVVVPPEPGQNPSLGPGIHSTSSTRTSLAQSNFSFMLGQNDDQTTSKPSPSRAPAHSGHSRSSSLFGNERRSHDGAADSSQSTAPKQEVQDDDEFDFRSLQRAKRRPA